MFDVHLNPTTKLWMIDASRAIDFSGVVGTQRNCSGGITPWGTTITAEESRGTTDLNADGYMDMGWLVEIDPTTYKIAEYGTGKAQKLWAAGNGSHENVATASDSLTLYWGEDASDGSVFKFVADNKMNMSSGKLYALKLDAQLVNNEPVVQSGVWTLVPNTTATDRNTSYALAKALGSTLFNGVEDIEIGTVDKKIYFTAKGNSRTYRFKDNGLTVSEFETFVGGTSYSFITGTSTVTTEAWGTGNDNLTFDDRGNLYVLQDGSQDHIWMVRPDHTQENPKVELFATTPLGSEPTGMTFSPDYKYMFISMQEPSSSNTLSKVDAGGNSVVFNKSTLLVISRIENLGNSSTTDIQSETLNASVVLYPNPTSGIVNIQFNLKQAGLVNIDVVDISGNVVLSPINKEFSSGENTVQFQLNDSGIYFVKVYTPSGMQTHKVIVK
jgi:secreted PhoX family phosphatase